MPAGMEMTDTMMSVREVPWHRHMNAVTLDESPKTIDEGLEKSGMSWQVLQVPVTYTNPVTGDLIEDPSIRLNLRSDTGDVLGRVTKDYRVLQNREAFEFLANVVGSECHWETAGSLHGGRMVYVTVRFPEWIEVGGDKTGMYGFVSNHHGGWQATKAKATAVRVVCQNTFNAALKDGLPVLSIPHYGDPQKQLLQARETMGLIVKYGEQFKEFGDRLASSKFTEKKLRNVLEELYPSGPNDSDRKKQNKEDVRNHIVWMFKEAPTCTEMANAPGTAWTALQAITEFADYGDKAESDIVGDDAFLSRCMDDPKNIKQKAADLIMARI